MPILFLFVQILLFIISVIILPDPSASISTPLKIIISASFIAVSVYFCFTGDKHPYKIYILTGMIMCFIGDCIMSRVFPIKALNSFNYGALAFCAAHLLFITAYVKLLYKNGGSMHNTYFIAGLVLYSVVVFAAWKTLIYSVNHTPIVFGALVYLLLVGVMAAFALSLLSTGSIYIITALGGIFFLLSDFILCTAGYGCANIRYTDIAIWSTYITALSGIIYTCALKI